MNKPLAIDLFCGIGGWTDGLLVAGFDCIGFDIERHHYGEHRYQAQLVLQDVLTLRGAQFKDAALIVASPPCQEFSWMAMPWSRAKQVARTLRGQDEFPANYRGSRTVAELTALFDACFRIQREACEAAGHHVPLVVENVRGAIPWVGRSRWNYGSFHLWGDVPALMPMTQIVAKCTGQDWNRFKENGEVSPDWRLQGTGGSTRLAVTAANVAHANLLNIGVRPASARKAASAMIARIPFELARHIGAYWYPREAVA